MTCMKENIPDPYVHHLRPGTVLDDRFLVGNALGEGGFGITYIGLDLTLDIKVAIKEYYPNGFANRSNQTQTVTATGEAHAGFFEKGKLRFLQEAQNIAKFSSEPGIVNVREYFEENNTAYIVMGYLDGEDLGSRLKNHGVFPAEEMFRLILPVADSLQKIHDAGIIHRDISPDNIMYRPAGTLTLMDFGSARYYTNEEKELSVVLKKGYAPEEQYRKNGQQGPWTDVYSLSATIYRCITGEVPEESLDRMRADQLKRPSELGVRISEPLERILMYGLEVFREDRCSSMQEFAGLIRKALNHQEVPIARGKKRRDGLHTQYADETISDSQYTRYADETINDSVQTDPERKKTCPRCKATIQMSSKYCEICGYDYQSASSDSKSNRKPLVYFLLGLIAVAALLLLLFLLRKPDDTADIPEPQETAAQTVKATETPTAAETPTATAAAAGTSGTYLYQLPIMQQLNCDTYAYEDSYAEYTYTTEGCPLTISYETDDRSYYAEFDYKKFFICESVMYMDGEEVCRGIYQYDSGILQSISYTYLYDGEERTGSVDFVYHHDGNTYTIGIVPNMPSQNYYCPESLLPIPGIGTVPFGTSELEFVYDLNDDGTIAQLFVHNLDAMELDYLSWTVQYYPNGIPSMVGYGYVHSGSNYEIYYDEDGLPVNHTWFSTARIPNLSIGGESIRESDYKRIIGYEDRTGEDDYSRYEVYETDARHSRMERTMYRTDGSIGEDDLTEWDYFSYQILDAPFPYLYHRDLNIG